MGSSITCIPIAIRPGARAVVFDGVIAALGESGLAATLRGSFWLYPLINAGHIIGLAMLFGGILPLDLRLIGCWRSVPIAPLMRVLMPVAIVGLGIALITGPLLFVVQPVDYAANPYFLIKLLLIGCAVTNALLLRLAPAWRALSAGAQPAGPRLRVAGVLSVVLWLGALICGRMIGYY